MQQIGIFCGTFNPIHHGHLLIAEFARIQFALEKVIFVTSANPPHRRQGLLDAVDRHALVVAAVSTNQNFDASDEELNRSGPSYTVETLEHFQRIHPDAQLNLIIGGDNVPYIAGWHRSQNLFKLARILVAPRLRYHEETTSNFVPTIEKTGQLQDETPPGARVEIIDFPGVAFSSSLVRERIKQGKSVRYMVPREVYELLMAKGYYGKQASEPPKQSASQSGGA